MDLRIYALAGIVLFVMVVTIGISTKLIIRSIQKHADGVPGFAVRKTYKSTADLDLDDDWEML